MIKKILSNASNKVKAIYLLWILINLCLLLFNSGKIYYYNLGYEEGEFVPYIDLYDNAVEKLDNKYVISHTKIFFPLTSPFLLDMKFVAFYDMTEFIFYTIFPIFIYVIIKLFTTKDKPNE